MPGWMISQLKVLDNAKLLGLYTDQTLFFNDHTNSLVNVFI